MIIHMFNCQCNNIHNAAYKSDRLLGEPFEQRTRIKGGPGHEECSPASHRASYPERSRTGMKLANLKVFFLAKIHKLSFIDLGNRP